MKRTLIAIAGIGAIAAALVLLRMPAAVPEDGCVDPSAEMPLDSCSCAAPHGAEDRSFAATAHPVVWSDLPVGPFRNQLEALPSEIQEKVLRTLRENSALLNDIGSLRVDSDGKLLYVCFAQYQEESEKVVRTVTASRAAAGGAVPIDSPPIRHSRSGASKVLFLDFNGHIISGTAWNSSEGISSWDCRPYDIDGDEFTFSVSEQEHIIEIWERVAEDYAPFDIDVTTEEPAVWNRYKGHVLITPGMDKVGNPCPHNGFGGIAYLNPFGLSDYANYSPAWVLDYSSSQSPSIVAETASHEFGHNLGLNHDGRGATEYYDGHTGVTVPSWGPIMGTSYSRNMSQWSKGEYYDASNTQNDLFIMAGKLAYRPDDHGNVAASASLLGTSSLGEVAAQGVIERTDDPDVFYFFTSAGTLSITAEPYRAGSATWGGNLDIWLQLFTEGGDLVAENNLSSQASATISEFVSEGKYFLHIKPVGVGSPEISPPSGYTAYGSLGQYFLSGFIAVDTDFDVMPNQWEFNYFGSPTGAVATADADGDGSDNLTEFIAGYDPTDATSVFKISSFVAPASGNAPFIINWNTVPGRVYHVGWTENISAIPYEAISVELPYTVHSYTDTVERTSLQNFYRVEVRLQD